MGPPHARVLTGTVAINAAATVIAVREPAGKARVLVGRRGRNAAFMPDKIVFPGGRVDPEDEDVVLSGGLAPVCRDRLAVSSSVAPETLATAAIRELWEETGQILGTPGPWPDAPPAWSGFAAQGFRPDARSLTFVFRAVTPAGRPRRFDARFFLVDATQLATDPDDFTHAEDELSGLQWMPIAEARSFDLPFITQVALAEIAARLPDLSAPERVPFFRNDPEDIAIDDVARI